ncbi:MAG TPA: hypothetical protein VLK84_32595, partial [Longimicrobium sp.]|nr:hypothetical protein [Longimicrobium sp.]
MLYPFARIRCTQSGSSISTSGIWNSLERGLIALRGPTLTGSIADVKAVHFRVAAVANGAIRTGSVWSGPDAKRPLPGAGQGSLIAIIHLQSRRSERVV